MKSLFFCTGDDESNIHENARVIFRQWTGDSPDEFAVEIYKESEEKEIAPLLDELMMALRTPPFLGGRKTVWLQHAGFLDRESSLTDPDKIKDDVALRLFRLATFIASEFPDDINLVIDGLNADINKPLFKACGKIGKVKVHAKPNLRDRNWQQSVRRIIDDKLADRQMTLSGESITYLIEVIGVDTARINQEVEKIYCYAGQNPTFAQVQDVCTGNREAVYYALANAVGERNLNQALRTIAQFDEHARDTDYMALGQMRQLGRLINDLLHAKVLMAVLNCRSAGDLPNRMKTMSPDLKECQKHNVLWQKSDGQIRALAHQSGKYAGQELVQAINLIAKANKNMVSTSMPSRMVLELVVCQIVGIQAAAAGK